MVNRKPLSVSQLNGYVKGVFEDELVLHNVSVYGEIYEFGISGQNTFLTLKEGDCSLSCVRYGVTEKYDLGTKVLLGGTVTFYPRGGKVSFVFRTIEPYGQSVQYAAFLKLKEKLRAAGWFENRPSLKPFVKDVAIVTSPTGAVIHDFLRVVGKQPFVNVHLFPVKVQGDGAPEEIAAAIDAINAQLAVDVIVVARGGGANVDLEPFNTEAVSAAVHRSAVPVLSAVGHETDFTLCDFCASARAATPSVAAEMIVSANAKTLDYVVSVTDSMTRACDRLYAVTSQRLYRASQQGMSAAERSAAVCRQKVSFCALRTEAAVSGKIDGNGIRIAALQTAASGKAEALCDDRQRRLEQLCARLETRNPLKLLADGYARVSKQGVDVTAVGQLEKGDEITVRFADGTVEAKVGEKHGI